MSDGKNLGKHAEDLQSLLQAPLGGWAPWLRDNAYRYPKPSQQYLERAANADGWKEIRATMIGFAIYIFCLIGLVLAIT